MTETQAPYTASTTGGTFTLKVRPLRCEVGEALWRDIDTAIRIAEHDEYRSLTDGGKKVIRAALVAYFTHKNGEWGNEDSAPCFACHEARKAAAG